MILQILLKIPQLQQRSKAANHDFSIKDYFKDDWAVILASFVTVGIVIICIDELIAVKPELANYIKWLFVFVGFTGSSILQAVLSVTNKKIMAIIDIKTNIADGVNPPVDATNIAGVSEIKKDELKTTFSKPAAPNDDQLSHQ